MAVRIVKRFEGIDIQHKHADVSLLLPDQVLQIPVQGLTVGGSGQGVNGV